MHSPRSLVLIVAYQAERHLAGVLSRIPPDLIRDPSIEFLIIDDGSSDNGAAVGRRWADAAGATNVTILRNPANQGYGGNQKLGYRIALDAGVDFVILLHGDGQYAPELLGEFLRIRRETGRRCRAGLPHEGPRVGEAGRHAVVQAHRQPRTDDLPERHDGSGALAVPHGIPRLLDGLPPRVPFEINANGFHFDTEILLQAFHVRATIRRVRDPHALRRRHLPRQRPAVRDGRDPQHPTIPDAPVGDARRSEVPAG